MPSLERKVKPALTDEGNGMTFVSGGEDDPDISILGSLGVASALGGLELGGVTDSSAFSGTFVSASSSSSGAIWKCVRFSNWRCRLGIPARGVKAPWPFSVEKVGVAERVLRWVGRVWDESSTGSSGGIDVVDGDGER